MTYYDEDLMSNIDDVLDSTRDAYNQRQERQQRSQRPQTRPRQRPQRFHQAHPDHVHRAGEGHRRQYDYQPDGQRSGQMHPTQGGPPNSPRYPEAQRFGRERPRGQNSERHYDDVRRMYDRQHPGDPHPDPNAHRFHRAHGNHGAAAPQYENQPPARGTQQDLRAQYDSRGPRQPGPGNVRSYQDEWAHQEQQRAPQPSPQEVAEQQREARHRQMARDMMAPGYDESLPLPGLREEAVTHRVRLGEDNVEARPLREARPAPQAQEQYYGGPAPHQGHPGYNQPQQLQEPARAYVDAQIDPRTAYERSHDDHDVNSILEEIGRDIRAHWQRNPSATIRGRNLRGKVLPEHQDNFVPPSALPTASLQPPPRVTPDMASDD